MPSTNLWKDFKGFTCNECQARQKQPDPVSYFLPAVLLKALHVYKERTPNKANKALRCTNTLLRKPALPHFTKRFQTAGLKTAATD